MDDYLKRSLLREVNLGSFTNRMRAYSTLALHQAAGEFTLTAEEWLDAQAAVTAAAPLTPDGFIDTSVFKS